MNRALISFVCKRWVTTSLFFVMSTFGVCILIGCQTQPSPSERTSKMVLSASPSSMPFRRRLVLKKPAPLPSSSSKPVRPLRVLKNTRGFGRDILEFSHDGTLLMATSPVLNRMSMEDHGHHDAVGVWNVATAHEVLDFHASRIVGALLSSDDKKVYVSAQIKVKQNFGIYSVDIETGRVKYLPLLARALAASVDGKWLAAQGRGELVLWNLKSNRSEFTFLAPATTSVIFTPDSRSLLAQDQYGMRMYNISNGEIVWRYKCSWPKQYFRSAPVISFDGRLIANVSFEQHKNERYSYVSCNINIWDASSGKLLRTIPVNPNRDPQSSACITSVALSPDSHLVAASLDVSEGSPLAALWDVKTGKLRFIIPVARPYRSDRTYTCYAIAFSPTGKVLALQSAPAGEIVLWPVR